MLTMKMFLFIEIFAPGIPSFKTLYRPDLCRVGGYYFDNNLIWAKDKTSDMTAGLMLFPRHE